MKSLLYTFALLCSVVNIVAQDICSELLPGSFSICENFEDGSLETGVIWSGDQDSWIINMGVLQSNGPAVTGTELSLSTPFTNFGETEWSFFVNPELSTSSGNYIDVYLSSDQADLTADVSGYFVRIGGTPDEVSLFKSTAGSEELLIDGEDGTIGSSSTNPVRIKVRRNSVGEWTLWRDLGNAGLFIEEGVVLDNDITTSAFFGLFIRYSQANASSFLFDDIYVGLPRIDTESPTLVSAIVEDISTVLLQFSEPLNPTEVGNLSNYSLATVSAVLDSEDPSLVRLALSTPLNIGSTSLTVSGLTDIEGNEMESTIVELIYSEASPFDVIFNELFPDESPSVGLPEYEFIELHNRTAETIQLIGWDLTDDYPNSGGVFPNVEIPANGYLIVTDEGDAAEAFAGIGPTIGLDGFPSLNNGGDDLVLFKGSTIIDQVSYTDGWYRDISKDDGGWTIERINSDNTCFSSSNWIASEAAAGGTPGSINSVVGVYVDEVAPSLTATSLPSNSLVNLFFSETLAQGTGGNPADYSFDPFIEVNSVFVDGPDVQLSLGSELEAGIIYTITVSGVTDCEGNVADVQTTQIAIAEPALVGDIIITEIYADINPSVGLPDFEYVEIYNRSSRIISLEDWAFDDVFPTESSSLSSQLILPGEYIILCKNGEAEEAYLALGNSAVIGNTGFPALTDSGKSLYLSNGNGDLIDNVEFSRGWYRNGAKDDGGYSLERINYDNLCNTAGNWIASEAEIGGTPGLPNSVLGLYPDVEGPQVLGLDLPQNNVIEIFFSEAIDAELAAALSSYSLSPSISINTVLEDLNSVQLFLDQELDPDLFYELSINSIEDCEGNAMLPVSLTLAIPQEADPYDVLINEIYADITTIPDYDLDQLDLPDARYVELYNRGEKAINLVNWIFRDRNDTSFLSGYLLLPDSYVVLCDEDEVSKFVSRGIPVLGVESFPSINPTADQLTLLNSSEVYIDDAYYERSFYQDGIKDDGKWSLERIDPNVPCSFGDNWKASSAEIGGTPGEVNSVLASRPDNVSPSLLRAEIANSSSIVLYFSEILDRNAAEDPSKFVVDQGVGPALASILLLPGFSSMVVAFDTEFQEDIVYTVTIGDSVTDCQGNPVVLDNTAKFGITKQAEAGDIVINEIMFDPNTGAPEYVEVYNRSNKIIDLSNWYTGTVNLSENPDSLIGLNRICAQLFSIFPDSYVVLVEQDRIEDGINIILASLPADNLLLNTYGGCGPLTNQNILPTNLPSLTNETGTIAMSDLFQSVVMDQVTYDANWHNDLLDITKGTSLERINYDGPSQDENNWNSAATVACSATPGYLNSQFYPGGLSEGTLSPNPQVFSPNMDGEDDFTMIEVQFNEPGYVLNISIFDDRGRNVNDLVQNAILGENASFKWDGNMTDGGKAPLGTYIIRAEAISPNEGKVEKFTTTCVVAAKL